MQTRRLSSRKILQTTVWFEDEFGDALMSFTSSNLSLTGMFIKAEQPFRTGTHVFIKFSLPGELLPIRTTGQIMRIAAKKRGPGRRKKPEDGFGLRFVGMAPLDMKRLLAFCSS